MCKEEKINMPMLKVLTVPENGVIRIDDQIFGKLTMVVVDDDGAIKGDERIEIPGYNGENVLITLPKSWVDRKILVCSYRMINAKKISNNDVKVAYNSYNDAFYWIRKTI